MTEHEDPIVGLLDALIQRADKLDESLTEDKKARLRENTLRDKRIRWSRIAIVFALVIGALALAVGITAKATGDDIVATRKDGRQAVCGGFSIFANSLVAAGTPPKTEDELAKRQAAIDSFENSLNSGLAPLGCHIDLVAPPPVSPP